MLFHYKKNIFLPDDEARRVRADWARRKIKNKQKPRAAKENMNKCKKNKKLCGALVASSESCLRLERIHRLFGASSLGLAGWKVEIKPEHEFLHFFLFTFCDRLVVWVSEILNFGAILAGKKCEEKKFFFCLQESSAGESQGKSIKV